MKKTYTYLLVMLFGITLSAQSNLQFTSSCDDLIINACSTEQVTLTATATTNCVVSPNLLFNYQLDENNDGSVEWTGSSNEVSETFPLGEHRVIFTVTDQCNNSLTCEYLFTLADTEPPVPVCLNGLATVVMPAFGMVTIWASDLESGTSFDNCSDYEDLIFSFSSDITETSIVFDCDDVCLAQGDPVPVEVWVTDESGNQDFCLTYVLFVDIGICECLPTSSNNLLIDDINGCDLELTYDFCINGSNCIQLTGDNDITILVSPSNEISLKKTDDPVNGVTTFDIVLIMQHILGTNPLSSPFLEIAADVNLSNTVTTFDIVVIRRLLLGIDNQFPMGDSWVFSPPTQTVQFLIQDFQFTAIKLGDINLSATPMAGSCLQGNTTVETRNLEDPLQLFTPNQFLEKGKTYSIPIFAENYKDLFGGQFTLNFAKEKIDIDEIIAEELASLRTDNFNINKNAGELLGSWTNGITENLESTQPLFELKITAKENTSLQDVLEINSNNLKAEAYKEIDTGFGFLDIQFNILEQPTEGVEVIPNPFTDFANIYFTNKEAGQVELNIFDLSGKNIFSQNKNMDSGNQQLKIEKRDLPLRGIYFYQVKTTEKIFSGKIIQQ